MSKRRRHLHFYCPKINSRRTYGQSGERDLDVRVHKVSGLSSEGMLQVGHDGRIHSGQTIRPVNADYIFGPLSFGGNSVGEQQIPVEGREARKNVQDTPRLMGKSEQQEVVS